MLDHTKHSLSTYVHEYTKFVFLSLTSHSVWQPLGPSTSLKMTQLCSFSWLSNTALYACTSYFLSNPPSVDSYVSSMSPLYCPAAINIGVHASFRIAVFSGLLLLLSL